MIQRPRRPVRRNTIVRSIPPDSPFGDTDLSLYTPRRDDPPAPIPASTATISNAFLSEPTEAGLVVPSKELAGRILHLERDVAEAMRRINGHLGQEYPDSESPHGIQRVLSLVFGEGVGRLSPLGIQFIRQNATVPAIAWLAEPRYPNDTLIDPPTSYISGEVLTNGAGTITNSEVRLKSIKTTNGLESQVWALYSDLVGAVYSSAGVSATDGTLDAYLSASSLSAEAASLNAKGIWQWLSASKTIATGSIAITEDTFLLIDTEAAAATDDLDTITNPFTVPSNGTFLICRAANTARTVVFKNGTGNLNLNGDFTADDTNKYIVLMYNVTTSKWDEVTRSNAGAATSSQSWTYRLVTNADATTTADDCIIGIAKGTAARTVNLVTAVGNTGLIQGVVIVSGTTGDSVTVNPNGTETIGGETDLTMFSVGAHLLIQSDGANWNILSSSGAGAWRASIRTNSSTVSDNVAIMSRSVGGTNETITLDTADQRDGTMKGFVKRDTGVGSIIIDGNGTQTIGGETTYTLQAKTDSALLIAGGGDWELLSATNLLRGKQRSESANYTTTGHDAIIAMDASGAARTVTLVSAVGMRGVIQGVVKTDTSANTVTVDPNSTETIRGATTHVLRAQYEYVMFISDGTNWQVIGHSETSYQVVAADITTTALDRFIDVSGTRTITLVAAAGNRGVWHVIKKTDSGSNTVTIDGNGTDTIDGESTRVLASEDQALFIYCDGSNWKVVNTPNSQFVAKTTTYTTTQQDSFVKCDASAGAFTVTTHSAASSFGLEMTFKKTDSTTNVVTIDANGTETIDGALTVGLSTQYQAVTIVSDGSNWLIKSRMP